MVKAIDRKVLRDLSRLKGQVLTIALVVASGISVYVAMWSVYASLQYTRDTYYERYRFAQVFASVKRAPEGLADRLREVPGVAALETRIVGQVPIDLPELTEPASGQLVSIPEHDRPILNDLYLRAGRRPEPGRGDEVLASEAFANANGFQPGAKITAVINGRRQELTIVGIALSPEFVFQVRPGELMPDDRRFGIFWMRRDALAAAFQMTGAFNDIVVRLSPGASEDEVISRLDLLLAPWGSLGAYGRDEQVSALFLREELRQLESSATITPAIFLGVAAFLLNVVLTRLIGTQREQIAALKALGYGNGALAAHYLKLVLAIVLTGALVGCVLGAWLGNNMMGLYAQFYHFPGLLYQFDPGVAGLAVLISVAAAVAGALGAVRQVAKLHPAEAMRPAAPPVYKATVLERLGFERLLSSMQRMVLRNLERRPLRLFISSIAIAFSVAILVLGRFAFDAIGYIVEVQFERAETQDLTVTWREPVSSRACGDLLHLDGVLACEPMRSVPVEFKHGPRSRRLAITGMHPDGRLRRILDQDLRPLVLPPEGLVLNSYLAKMLEVEAGDRLRVEILERRRREVEVPVVALVEEFMGLSAYMELTALNRLMGERPLHSGAYLSIEKGAADRVFQALKQRPATAGVALRERAMRAFTDTTAQSMLTTTILLAVFASIIAVGVVYNNARIALSERSRELASLRVLGFTRGEISYLLLAELSAQLLIAMPVGCVLGYGLTLAMATGLETELYRIPVIIHPRTYAFAIGVVAASGFLSALLVRRKLDHLDLIGVLKTRE